MTLPPLDEYPGFRYIRALARVERLDRSAEEERVSVMIALVTSMPERAPAKAAIAAGVAVPAAIVRGLPACRYQQPRLENRPNRDERAIASTSLEGALAA